MKLGILPYICTCSSIYLLTYLSKLIGPGRIDEGEDAFTSAIRETKEEVDYSVDDLNIFKDEMRQIKQDRRNGKEKKLIYWLAELKDSYKVPVLSDEHSGYLWLRKDEIVWVHDNPEFLEMIRSFDDTIEKMYSQNTSSIVQ